MKTAFSAKDKLNTKEVSQPEDLIDSYISQGELFAEIIS